jgi:hypothetical protein
VLVLVLVLVLVVVVVVVVFLPLLPKPPELRFTMAPVVKGYAEAVLKDFSRSFSAMDCGVAERLVCCPCLF